jgi:PAS domain S-box-containing protein
MGNLLQRVSQLPTSSVILFLTLTRDGTGNRFVSAEAQQLVSTSANVPLYNFIDAAFGYGSVGGCMIPIEANGRRAAELVSRVLAGEKADAIAPVVIQDNPHLFDWRELKRWGIAESTLPPGSVVHFKAPSIWETHKWSIVGIAAFFLVQSAFIAGLSINLARRKRAEAALLLSEANLKTAQEVAQIGGFIFDIPQDALSWSEGTREVFGVPVGTKIRYRAFLRMVHPDDRDYVDANWQTAQKGAPTEIEYRTVIGGNTRWIRTKVAVELTSEGRPLVARGIVQDISDRKKSEEEAAWLRHELAHAARISTVGELGQNLAHEVNQPLAAIVANAEAGLLLLKEPQPDLAEVQEALKDIVSDQKRAEAVVRRIRSLVKKDRPVFRRVDLNDVARDAAAVVQADATAQGVRIHTDLADGLPPVWGDTVQLQQVAINLLTNALDAVDSDATAPHWIRITTSAAGGDDPTLAVSDNGPGIDAKIAAHLFAPFFTTKSDGMGLGLSISRSIVTAHGGTIRAEANDNGGATFKVSLPTVSQACVEGDAAACPRTGV